jgi:hypothetical protein
MNLFLKFKSAKICCWGIKISEKLLVQQCADTCSCAFKSVRISLNHFASWGLASLVVGFWLPWLVFFLTSL